MMLFIQNCFRCHPKCYLPIFSVHRTLKMAKRKKYIRRSEDGPTRAHDAYLQVIGSGAPDQSPSILLRTINSKFLFNCGENNTRLFQDLKIPLKDVKHVFLTQSKWERIGGLTSLIFQTVAHSGFPPIFHGPSNLHKIVQRMIFLSSLGSIFKHRFDSNSFQTTEPYDDDGILIESVELTHLQETAIIYLCKLKETRGKFSLAKSLEKNVPVTMLSKLYHNENITLDDGTVITPADVNHPDMPEMFIFFIDIPSEGFLKDLATNQKLKTLLEKTKSTGVEVMIHFTPNSVFKTARYQNFIELVNAKRHLTLNDQNKYSALKKVHHLQTKLNKIDPKLHPLLSMKLDANPKIYDPNDETCQKFGRIPMLYTKYILRRQQEDEKYDELDTAEESRLAEFNKMLEITVENEQELYQQTVPSKLINEEFPRFVFLGTGSGDSDILRNSSGILVHLSKDVAILLDCGGGISSQINRFYGDEAPKIFQRIKAVFISHMHLDHHIGLVDLFQWRRKFLSTNRNPLYIFCPVDDLKSWLFFYAKYIDQIYLDMKFIDNDILVKGNLSYDITANLNIDSVLSCPVEHFRKSYAYSLTFPYMEHGKRKQFKLAYSGDTSLNKDFTRIGQNADLLIHEATFQDELKETAIKYRHSTFEMALQQAKNMSANHTILTHFSSRYHILPYIQNDLKGNIGIAFDYMEVTPNDLPRLNSFVNKYREAFPDIENSLQQKTMNYRRQMEEHEIY